MRASSRCMASTRVMDSRLCSYMCVRRAQLLAHQFELATLSIPLGGQSLYLVAKLLNSFMMLGLLPVDGPTPSVKQSPLARRYPLGIGSPKASQLLGRGAAASVRASR